MKKWGRIKNQKIQFYLALIVIIALLIIIPALSWIFYQRGLQTVSKIQAPDLQIWEGHYDKEKAESGEQSYLFLNDIDVESDTKEKEYVFCVYGDIEVEYMLQLGYTTNNPFTYEIYAATETEIVDGNIPEGAVIEPNNANYYYTKTTNSNHEFSTLGGEYLTDDYHALTFDDEENKKIVQKNAEPIYWQSDTIIPNVKEDGSFVEYYILKIKWSEGIKNNKETDMVYLIAGLSNQ
jgi:hypothetical protein